VPGIEAPVGQNNSLHGSPQDAGWIGCTARAAVTIAALDSEVETRAEYVFAEKFQPKISTQQKICASMPI
jgi:hypothetical protein